MSTMKEGIGKMRLCWSDVLAVVGMVVGILLLVNSVTAILAWQHHQELLSYALYESLREVLPEEMEPKAGFTCEIKLPDNCTLEDGVMTIVIDTSLLGEGE